MDRRDAEMGAILQITGRPVPSYIAACRCGARTIDVYGYVQHDHLRARCTGCNVWYRDWIDRAVIGATGDSRASRFIVPPSTRFAVLRRDKFCCVHCGRPAPRSGDAFGEIRNVIVAAVGSEHSLAVARDAHASTCIHCGQMLPGILQSIPYDVYRGLDEAAKQRIWDLLDRGRLQMDHLIPHALISIDGVVSGQKESDLVRETLLVTSCKECNWGRRDTLERWDEIDRLIVQCILRGRRDASNVRGYARQIYFRARLEAARRAG